VKLAYSDRGDGLPVVWIHGLPHNRSLWANQLDAVGDGVRSIAPDLRGFGDSPAEAPYSIDRYADDIAELLDGLAVPAAVIGGISMGGHICFAFWRRYRRRVLGLILADTRAGTDDEAAKNRRRSLIALARDKGAAAVADAQIIGMLGATTRKTRPDLVASTHSMLASAPVGGIIGALEAMMNRADSTSTLATIDVPTLVIGGKEDALTQIKEVRGLHQAIADSDLVVIPRAGHLPNIEQPEAFNAAVRSFLVRVQDLAA